MALRTWQGRAAVVRQITTIIVGGTVGTGQVYSVTINGRVVSYTALVTDTSNTLVATGLANALATSSNPEFQEVSWSSSAAVVTGTGADDGTPFISSSAATGTGTLVTSVTTAASGPNFWSVAANWSGTTVPVTGDDVVINDGPDILHGLAQSAVTLATLTIGSNFKGVVGRPAYGGSGANAYPEYRTQRLQISATILAIDSQSKRIRIDLGTAASTMTFNGGGSATSPALDVLAVNSANILRLTSGGVIVAFNPGEVSTFSEIHTASIGNNAPSIAIGSGVTLATLTQDAGQVRLEASVTTIIKNGGNLDRAGSGTVGTMRNRGGTVNDSSTGTITTFHNGADYKRIGAAPVTITTATVYRGSTTIDDNSLVTWTNPVNFYECHTPGPTGSPGPSPAYFQPGIHRKLTVASI